MNKEVLLKKIERIRNQHIQDCITNAFKKKYERGAYYDSAINSFDSFDSMLREPLGIPYRPRLGIFKMHRVEFNPLTYHGTSYGWYDITRRIKGIVLLNTYGYSRQTSKHVGMLHELLKQLGVKYQCIEAPNGLQNLDGGLEHTVYEIARRDVAFKYARIKTRDWHYAGLKKSLKVWAKLGYGPKKFATLYKRMVVVAEGERARRLKRAQDKRAQERIEVVIDLGRKHMGAEGLHVELTKWQIGDASFAHINRSLGYDRTKAHNDMQTKIYVHRKIEPKPVFDDNDETELTNVAVNETITYELREHAEEFAIFDVKNNVAIQYGPKDVLEKRLMKLNT